MGRLDSFADQPTHQHRHAKTDQPVEHGPQVDGTGRTGEVDRQHGEEPDQGADQATVPITDAW